MKDYISKTISDIETMATGVNLPGIPSGFIALDRITLGWQKSNLYIIGGRPGMGKSSLALSFAKNASLDFNKKTALFSLEMTEDQLVKRLISCHSEICLNKINKGSLDNHEFIILHENSKKLSVASMHIDDNPNYTISELIKEAEKLIKEKNIELIIIDNLQLFKEESSANLSNREQQLSHIIRSLKAFSKNYKIPVILLSQLNRQSETRHYNNKRPQLIDLRDSGAIEDIADMILFIYRPEYYGLEVDENNQPTKGRAEIIIAKNRHGSIVDLPLRFIGQYAKFADLDYTEGQDIYVGNMSTGIAQNTDFLTQPKTVQSAKWDDDEPSGNDIIRKIDIDEVF